MHQEKAVAPEPGISRLYSLGRRTMMPNGDPRLVYEDRYVETKLVGDLALVDFERSVTSAGSLSTGQQ